MMTMVDPFIGREKELMELKALLGKKTASLMVIKGRRRVGKTRLIEEFAKGKLFYKLVGLPPDDSTSAQSQRDEFARQLSRATDLPEVFADDWSKLFILLANQVKTGRAIVLLDEIQWMGSKDSEFLPKLKNIWESHFKKNPRVILILCGSVSTWIENNILSSTGYFGRVSWRLTLQPLKLSDCNRFLEALGFKYSAYEKFKILSVTGGIPWYIEQIQGQYNADDNLKRQCFNDGGVLFKDFDDIFHDLFNKRGTQYQRIVKSLMKKPLTYSEISDKTGYPSSGRLSEYLEELIEAGFISRDYTLSARDKKVSDLSVYRLSDNYLRFYLRYINPNKIKIVNQQFSNISIVSLPGYETIMGYQFENLVLENRSSLWEYLHIRPEDIVFDNPYFQRRTKFTEACQIDYLVKTKHNTYYLFEIKFSRNLVRQNVIGEIKKKIKKLNLPKGYACLPTLIHVNGYEDKLKETDFFFRIIDFKDLLS